MCDSHPLRRTTVYAIWVCLIRQPHLTMAHFTFYNVDIPPSGGNNSDHLEEQAMEIEAMQAVFMDDFNCGILLRF